jgi:hypothetical protein
VQEISAASDRLLTSIGVPVERVSVTREA